MDSDQRRLLADRRLDRRWARRPDRLTTCRHHLALNSVLEANHVVVASDDVDGPVDLAFVDFVV